MPPAMVPPVAAAAMMAYVCVSNCLSRFSDDLCVFVCSDGTMFDDQSKRVARSKPQPPQQQVRFSCINKKNIMFNIVFFVAWCIAIGSYFFTVFTVIHAIKLWFIRCLQVPGAMTHRPGRFVSHNLLFVCMYLI